MSIFVDFADDPAGAGDPVKRPRIAVVDPDVVVDRFGQFTNAPKGATADPFSSDLSEPALDLIEPRRAGPV
jgi:hypothetical protein